MDGPIKFSSFVKFPLQCFKVFGLIPFETGNRRTWKSNLLTFYHFVNIASMFISVMQMAIYIKLNINNLPLLTENAPPYGFLGVSIVKSISISIRKEEFSDLMKTLNDLFPKSRDEQKYFFAQNYLNSYKLMERIFSTIFITVSSSIIVTLIIKLIFLGVWNDKLPHENWYPFDVYDPKFYTFVFIWIIYLTFINLTSVLGTDLILYSFITMITMQFDILSKRLRDLKVVSSTDTKKKFVKLVVLHEILLRLSKKMDKIYSVSILINFSVSSILICLTDYQLSIETNIENYVKFAMLLTASLMQSLLLCYYGSKLTTASENVAEAIYDSGWQSRENNQIDIDLMMMLQRSQKPTVITAYKFSIVSLSVYTTVSFLIYF